MNTSSYEFLNLYYNKITLECENVNIMFHIHHSKMTIQLNPHRAPDNNFSLNSGSILENLSGIVNSTLAMYFPLL